MRDFSEVAVPTGWKFDDVAIQTSLPSVVVHQQLTAEPIQSRTRHVTLLLAHAVATTAHSTFRRAGAKLSCLLSRVEGFVNTAQPSHLKVHVENKNAHSAPHRSLIVQLSVPRHILNSEIVFLGTPLQTTQSESRLGQQKLDLRQPPN